MSAQPPGLYPWLRETYSKLARAGSPWHHATLLTAPKGLGKEQLVARLVELRHCSLPSSTKAGQKSCGKCQNCLLHASATHPDHVLIEPLEGKAQISIEQVRASAAKVANKGLISPYRVVQINRAEAMTVSAANALLKLLEEPPANVYFILSTDKPSQLPATVLSRCAQTVIALPQPEQTLNWVNRQLETPISITQLHLVECAPLSALAMAEQNGFSTFMEIIDRYCVLLSAVNTTNFDIECLEFIALLRTMEKSVAPNDMLNLIQWLNHLALKLRYQPRIVDDELLPNSQINQITGVEPRFLLNCNSGVVALKQQIIQNNGINVLLQLQQVIVNWQQHV